MRHHGGVADDAWYRSEVWDREARTTFEARLARVRDGHGEYLRIQGLTLLGSRKRSARKAGVALLHRVIDEFPGDHDALVGAHAHLAEYYQERDNFDLARDHFRQSILAESTRSNRRWQCGLALAALLAADPEGRDNAEATSLLDIAIEEDRSVELFAPMQLRYLLARSRVEERQGNEDLAAAYALGVAEMLDEAERLELEADGAEPEGADPSEVRGLRRELEARALAGAPDRVSPLVDDFRAVDGQVRWVWRLVRQLHRAPSPGQPLVSGPDRLIIDLERDLREAGFETFDLSSWSVKEIRGAAEVRRAAAILLRHFDQHADGELRAAVARAITDPRARKVAARPMLDAFAELHSPDLADLSTAMTNELGVQRRLKSALGSAVSTLARDPEFDRIEAVIRDPRHGSDRVYLFWAVQHLKAPAAVDLCLELIDDEDVGMAALQALSDLKSVRARPVLETLAGQPTTRKRDDASQRARMRVEVAQHALEKLDRAIAAGKARP